MRLRSIVWLLLCGLFAVEREELYPTSLLLRPTGLPRLPMRGDDSVGGLFAAFRFGSLLLLNILNIDGRFGFFCDASLTLRPNGFVSFAFFFRCGNELNLRSTMPKKNFGGDFERERKRAKL